MAQQFIGMGDEFPAARALLRYSGTLHQEALHVSVPVGHAVPLHGLADGILGAQLFDDDAREIGSRRPSRGRCPIGA
jgi:hypothetical protein